MSELHGDFDEITRAAHAARSGRFKLRLFVAGSSPRSIRAVSNIRSICEEHLSGRYDLEVVDLYRRPELAMKEQLLAAPTLVKDLPPPARKIVGDMSDRRKVMLGLNIEAF